MAANPVGPGVLCTARSHLASGYPLALAVLAYVFWFLLGPGPKKAFFVLLELVLLANLAGGAFRHVFKDAGRIAVAGVPAVLIGLHLAVPDPVTDPGFIRDLVGFAVIGLAVMLAYDELSPPGHSRLSRWTGYAAGFLVVLHVLQSLLAQWFEFGRVAARGGLWTNPHLLANFALLTLPLMLYHASAADSARRRGLYGGLAGLDLYLLLATGSRPAWLGFFAGLLVAAAMLVRGRKKFWALLGISLIPGMLYGAGAGIFRTRIDEFLGAMGEEERIALWSGTLRMLGDQAAPDWVVGRGIGSFKEAFVPYSSLRDIGDFIFPHNFLLEVLVTSGVGGLLVLVAAYLLFFGSTVRRCRQIPRRRERLLSGWLLAGFVMHFIHAFFTFPLYSTFTLYPQAVMIGLALAVTRAHRAS